tara:strand:- start:26986 stop:27294 length:309 start_codon:yes stop_codon:yes gene_type:complete
MNQISECCDAPLVYHIWEMENKSIGYEPWDFCPECLECCSGYDPQDKDRIKQLTEGANDDTIKRANKRLAKDLGFGRKDNDVDSQDDSIRDGFLYGPQQCAP